MKERIREIAGELIKTAAIRATRARPGGRGRLPPTRSSSTASPMRRPTTRTARSPKCSTTWQRASRWTGWCAATSASARPRSRCAPRSSRRWPGYQVALICPTTLLARQHYRTFVERLPGLPDRGRPAVAAGPGGRGQDDQGTAREGQGRHRHRHPRAAVEIDQVQEAGPGHCRRGAAFRGRPQGAAEGAEGGRPCAHPDRDADPAHAADGDVGPARAVASSRPRRSTGWRSAPTSRRGTRWWCARRCCANIIAAARASSSCRASPTCRDLEEWLREEVPEVKAVTAHGQMSATEVEERMSAFYDQQI